MKSSSNGHSVSTAEINTIGLDNGYCRDMAEKLNLLLANYSIFYQNTRGYHWNIKGDKFFELHKKFEELYNDLWLKIDEVAERILTLGHVPNHNYSDYQELAEIKESKDVHDGKKAVDQILNSFKIIISQQRELLGVSEEADDEGSHTQMGDYIREQEKLVWMYNSFMNR